MTIPGVSSFTSLLITSEPVEIDRFSSAKKVISYAGLDPSIRQSGDKEVRGGISKEGSVLRQALRCKPNPTTTIGSAYMLRRDEPLSAVALDPRSMC
ncbi:IS110 family transposase [Natrialbaceae archaeon A-CW2]